MISVYLYDLDVKILYIIHSGMTFSMKFSIPFWSHLWPSGHPIPGFRCYQRPGSFSSSSTAIPWWRGAPRALMKARPARALGKSYGFSVARKGWTGGKSWKIMEHHGSFEVLGLLMWYFYSFPDRFLEILLAFGDLKGLQNGSFCCGGLASHGCPHFGSQASNVRSISIRDLEIRGDRAPGFFDFPFGWGKTHPLTIAFSVTGSSKSRCQWQNSCFDVASIISFHHWVPEKKDLTPFMLYLFNHYSNHWLPLSLHQWVEHTHLQCRCAAGHPNEKRAAMEVALAGDPFGGAILQGAP